MFLSLDILGDIGKASLVYPVCVGTCIITFTLYSRFRLREELDWVSAAGLPMGVAGIGMLGIGD
jgi:multidrug transporter EmrE-like cation transporter